MTRFALLSFLVSILLANFSAAQSLTLSGTVRDENNLPMQGAAIKAVLLSDTAQWFGSTSDQDGYFSLSLSPANYRVEISFISYVQKNFELNLSENTHLGTINMQVSELLLDMVQVEDKAVRVSMEGDTSVYNADAYKTNRDADAKGLLEKMPGVTTNGGTVSVQGEQVQRVLVDGKEFFGNDPKVALNTIPAEIVDKIQVFDQLSEQSQASGFNDGNTIKTINIITKEGKSEGEFGKIFGGFGTDERYLAGGNINIFKGARRISILGLSNNVNQANFATEDIAGAVGSTVDQINNPRRGPRRAEVGTGSADDFLISPQNGINYTTALGFNFSDEYGTKLKLNGSYLYNRTENTNLYRLSRVFTSGSALGQSYLESAFQSSTSLNHKLNFRLSYDISEKSSILVRPSFSVQDFTSNTSQVFSTQVRDSLLSSGLNYSDANSYALNFNNEFLFNRKLAQKGQSFSVSLQSTYNTTDGNSALLSRQNDTNFVAFAEDWRADRDGLLHRQRLNFSYTHPLGERTSLELGYRPEWEKNTSVWTTRTKDGSDAYTITDTTLSNDFSSLFLTHEARFRLRYRTETNGFFVAGLSYEYTENTNEVFFPGDFTTTHIYRNFTPFALYRKTLKNKGSLFMLYRGSPRLPSAQQLNEVIDNTNPLQVSVGNLNLDQSFQHRFITRFSLTNTEKGTNFFVFASAEMEDDRISNSTTLVQADTELANGFVLPAGGQLTTPVNLDGYLNARTFANYGFPLGILRSNLNFNAGLNYNLSPGLIDGLRNEARTIGAELGFLVASNISDKVDFKFGATARNNWVDNTLAAQQNSDFQNYIFNAGGVFTVFDRWVLSSDMALNVYRGLGDLDQEFLLWNAGLGYQMLKSRALELRLTAFDLLAQNNSVSRTINETYIEDRETDILTRYFMLSLSYRLRNFKGAKG